jgi:hypothetical protein
MDGKQSTSFSLFSMKFASSFLLFISFLAADLAAAYAYAGQGPELTPQHLSGLDRRAYYKAMAEDKKDLVIVQLEELKSAPEDLRKPFMGAMLMKRASFAGSAVVKLRYFKEGRQMLEEAIKEKPDNAEFRFLRLMVQEHAPSVLGYRGSIEKDCAYIRKYYKSLPDELQLTIADYNKKSKFLKLDLS